MHEDLSDWGEVMVCIVRHHDARKQDRHNAWRERQRADMTQRTGTDVQIKQHSSPNPPNPEYIRALRKWEGLER